MVAVTLLGHKCLFEFELRILENIFCIGAFFREMQKKKMNNLSL